MIFFCVSSVVSIDNAGVSSFSAPAGSTGNTFGNGNGYGLSLKYNKHQW